MVNAAAVCDGTTLKLYLQTIPGGTYHLENSVPFVGRHGTAKPSLDNRARPVFQ